MRIAFPAVLVRPPAQDDHGDADHGDADAAACSLQAAAEARAAPPRQSTHHHALIRALVAAWDAEVPCGVLRALEPGADERPEAAGTACVERLCEARERYAQVFVAEGLALAD